MLDEESIEQGLKKWAADCDADRNYGDSYHGGVRLTDLRKAWADLRPGQFEPLVEWSNIHGRHVVIWSQAELDLVRAHR